METVFIEAINKSPSGEPFNWGKFMVARFTEEEWSRSSHLPSTPGIPDDRRPLLTQRGWTQDILLVLDLQTGEGAVFRPHPNASAHMDLEKHKIWVCVLFEAFLEWLYQQDLSDLNELPTYVELEAQPALFGHRRPGPGGSAPSRVAEAG